MVNIQLLLVSFQWFVCPQIKYVYSVCDWFVLHTQWFYIFRACTYFGIPIKKIAGINFSKFIQILNIWWVAGLGSFKKLTNSKSGIQLWYYDRMMGIGQLQELNKNMGWPGFSFCSHCRKILPLVPDENERSNDTWDNILLINSTHRLKKKGE